MQETIRETQSHPLFYSSTHFPLPSTLSLFFGTCEKVAKNLTNLSVKPTASWRYAEFVVQSEGYVLIIGYEYFIPPLHRFNWLLVQYQLVNVHSGSGLSRRWMQRSDDVRPDKDRILTGSWVGGQTPSVDQSLVRTWNRRTVVEGHSHLWDGHAFVVYGDGVQFNEGTRGAVLLLELGLIWLQHANLAPSMEEQGDRTNPQDQHEEHYQHLFRSHDYFGSWNGKEERGSLLEIILLCGKCLFDWIYLNAKVIGLYIVMELWDSPFEIPTDQMPPFYYHTFITSDPSGHHFQWNSINYDKPDNLLEITPQKFFFSLLFSDINY